MGLINKVGVLVLVGGLGLMGCDGQEAPNGEAPSAPEQQGSSEDMGDLSPAPETENRRSPAVPAEPLDPAAETPSEPADAGTHGVTDGAMVPAEPGSEAGAAPQGENYAPEPGSGNQGGNESPMPEAPDTRQPQE